MSSEPKRLTPADVARWKRKDTWTIYETAYLLCGYRPPDDMRAERHTPADVRDAANDMGRARLAGCLRTIGPEDDNGRKYHLRQRAVIAWASGKYSEFPFNSDPAVQTPNADNVPQILLPAGTRTVPTMKVAALIAGAFRPDAEPSSTEFQAALRSHTRMLNKAAREGTVQVVSNYGEPITCDDADATSCAGAFLTVDELIRYVGDLPLPIAVRFSDAGSENGPEPRQPKRPVPVHKQNDALVIAAIRAAGFDAKALPKSQNGKAGPKSAARKECTLDRAPFDKAWERLLAAKEIVYKE